MPAEVNHPSCPQPETPDCHLWRYMDLPRYLSLISSGSLYFSRIDLLGDPFEGSVTKQTVEERERLLDSLRAEPMVVKGLTAEQMEEFFVWSHRGRLKDVYASCWHMAAYESAAMWRLYGGERESLAIRTTYSTLAEMLPRECILGCVNYVDYDTDLIPEDNVLSALMHKRHSFSHEREVRALYWNVPPAPDEPVGLYHVDNPQGIQIPVDVGKLIEVVHVSPTSAAWFADLVRDVSGHYGLAAEVLHSHLMRDPLY